MPLHQQQQQQQQQQQSSQFYHHHQQMANGSQAPSVNMNPQMGQPNPLVTPQSQQPANNVILYSLNNVNDLIPTSSGVGPNLAPADSQFNTSQHLSHLPVNSQHQMRKLNLEWHGTFPNPNGSNLTSPMQSVEPWIQDEYPEIDINTPSRLFLTFFLLYS